MGQQRAPGALRYAPCSWESPKLLDLSQVEIIKTSRGQAPVPALWPLKGIVHGPQARKPGPDRELNIKTRSWSGFPARLTRHGFLPVRVGFQPDGMLKTCPGQPGVGIRIWLHYQNIPVRVGLSSPKVGEIFRALSLSPRLESLARTGS